MLRPMVLENSLDILLPGNPPDIGQKNAKAQKALQQIEPQSADASVLQQLHRSRGQHHKQKNRKSYGDKDRTCNFSACHFLLILAALLGGPGQGLHAIYQGFHQRDYAPQQRLFKDRVTVTDAARWLAVHDNLPVRLPHSNGNLTRAAHHHTFNNSLPAHT